MIGVLAIIGVISIGGVWGLNKAFTKHKVNNLIEDVKLAGFIVMDEMFETLPEEETSLAGRFTPSSGHPFVAFKESDVTFAIEASQISKEVCLETERRKVNWLEEIRPNGLENTCKEGQNFITFFFNTQLSQYPDMENNTCRTDRDCPQKTPYCNRGVCRECTVGKFKASNGKCYNCGSNQKTTQDDCHACENYFFSEDRQTCIHCENTTTRYIQTSKDECHRCPNRIKGGYCEHCNSNWRLSTNDIALCSKCPGRYVGTSSYCDICEGKVSADYQSCEFHCEPNYVGSVNGCVPCNSTAQVISLQGRNREQAKKDCESCTNRTYMATGDQKTGKVCALNCTNENDFLDATGVCRNCESDSFRLGWDAGSTREVEIYNDLLAKCNACSNMTYDDNHNKSCVSLDNTTKTWCFSPSRCKSLFKGKRYVAKATWVYECTLCPARDSTAWNELTNEQQEQCTP